MITQLNVDSGMILSLVKKERIVVMEITASGEGAGVRRR